MNSLKYRVKFYSNMIIKKAAPSSWIWTSNLRISMDNLQSSTLQTELLKVTVICCGGGKVVQLFTSALLWHFGLFDLVSWDFTLNVLFWICFVRHSAFIPWGCVHTQHLSSQKKWWLKPFFFYQVSDLRYQVRQNGLGQNIIWEKNSLRQNQKELHSTGKIYFLFVHLPFKIIAQRF